MSDHQPLAPQDFSAFFEALWSYSPFPWQQELVEEVHRRRAWPALVDLPTGTGKTSLLDIAVFLMALDAESVPSHRWMPRRVVNVVDRRVVVDQAADRATKIADGLAEAASATQPGPLATVATRLRHLAGTNPPDGEEGVDPPLLVATLRGAIVRDESWMRRPDVPAVLSSTVDQAGSRLLFRGYGISRGMRPIHAGLLGNDTLWLLDEVHLARPLAHTLRQVRDLRTWRTAADTGVPDRWGVVEMSATPTEAGNRARPSGWPTPASCVDDEWTFPHEPVAADSHPVIGRRLRASKPAELIPVKVPGDRAKADAAFGTACAKEAGQVLTEGARTIAVIVNRVDTARRIHAELDEAGITTVLLTGRMRPVDRDRTLGTWRDRLETSRARSAVEEPLILVATQCIEAGADFDLDAIVTEVASLDSLRQRFGRVDRDGQLSEAGQQATSRILVRSTDIKDEADDPIYGPALAATWRWLTRLGSVDFGIRRLPDPHADEPATDVSSLNAPARTGPILLPTHLDQLAQTSVAISGEPDVSRWLHGDDVPTSPDVQVVWRADIDEEAIRNGLRHAAERDKTATELSARLSACPPAATEAMTVPLAAVRHWLAQDATVEVTDVDGVNASDVEETDRPMRPWVTWEAGKAVPHDGIDRTRRRITPGSVVVVPALYGGIHAGTWDPSSADPVEDLATAALLGQGRLAVLRLHPALLPPLDDSDGPSIPTPAAFDIVTKAERRDLVFALLSALPDGDLDQAMRDAVQMVLEAVRPRGWDRCLRSSLVMSSAEGTWWRGAAGKESASVIVSVRPPKYEKPSILTGPTAQTDATDEANVFTGARVTLERHLRGVDDWARHLATQLGLPPELVTDLTLAGRLHDLGKHDPRFQLMLHEGDEVACAAAPEDLAKSARRDPSAQRRREIRRRSGYPRNARHELTSLPLADGPIGAGTDRDLVAHLVASHHGWCRPFAPPLIDDRPVKVESKGADRVVISSDHGMHRVDAGPADRFAHLNRRYGWFHLAWLEGILRLGDHRRSEVEQAEVSQHAQGAANR